MKYLLGITSILASVLILGCAHPENILPTTSRQDPNASYVVGVFAGMRKGHGYGLGLVDVNTKAKFLMPFADVRMFGEDLDTGDHVQMIQIPPGTYQIDSWSTYGADHAGVVKTSIPRKGNELQFILKPGRVYFIGKFTAFVENPDYKTTRWGVIPEKFDLGKFATMFKEAYPGFSVASIDS